MEISIKVTTSVDGVPLNTNYFTSTLALADAVRIAISVGFRLRGSPQESIELSDPATGDLIALVTPELTTLTAQGQ